MKSVKLLLINIFIATVAVYSQKKEDVFVNFGQQQRVQVNNLQKNLPLVLPNTTLPWNDNPNHAFKAGAAIQTEQQLNDALEILRKQYAPFLADYSPALPFIRKQVILDTFEWKLLATEMTTDANGNLMPLPSVRRVEDSTTWKMVTVPHYEGPINKAEAVYRKTIEINQKQLSAEKLFLHFDGVDYIAKVFVNGSAVGEHTGLFGAFEFDIRKFLHAGNNLLEVHVFNDAVMMGDNFFTGPSRKFGTKLAACGGPGWNEPGYAKGWTMCPAGFGIWQDCYLEERANCYVNDLYVRPVFDKSGAHVEVTIEVPDGVKNFSVLYSLYGQNFKSVLAENKKTDVHEMMMDEVHDGFRVLKFNVPVAAKKLRLWSTEKPWLYRMQIALLQNGKCVDAISRQFGMRSFTQSETSVPRGRFYLNNKEIKLRGANMMGNIMQCVMRKDDRQLIDDILLAKIAGMNFYRMTQQPCQQKAYEYFDKLGLMAQTDMPAFNGYRKDAVKEAKDQFQEMIRLIRNHPSNIVITYLNEPDFNKPMMLNRKEHQQLFETFDSVANTLNPGQVIKWIEGDYINLSTRYSDQHCYDIWYGKGIEKIYKGGWFDTHEGWMYGCGEFGAEGLDNVRFMKQIYPAPWLKIDSNKTWNPALIPRCQTPTVGAQWLSLKDSSMDSWVNSSQEYQYWAIRLFTEALRRNNNLNSFSVHLLIDAWPAGWLKSLMDAGRKPKPAYFAYLNALRPVAVNLRPDTFYGFSGDSCSVAVFVCNDKPETIAGASLRYQIEEDGHTLYAGSKQITVGASRSDFIGNLKFILPYVDHRKNVTVRAGLFDKNGKRIHDSSYDIELFPESDKGKKLGNPGGYAQRLISR